MTKYIPAIILATVIDFVLLIFFAFLGAGCVMSYGCNFFYVFVILGVVLIVYIVLFILLFKIITKGTTVMPLLITSIAPLIVIIVILNLLNLILQSRLESQRVTAAKEYQELRDLIPLIVIFEKPFYRFGTDIKGQINVDSALVVVVPFTLKQEVNTTWFIGILSFNVDNDFSNPVIDGCYKGNNFAQIERDDFLIKDKILKPGNYNLEVRLLYYGRKRGDCDGLLSYLTGKNLNIIRDKDKTEKTTFASFLIDEIQIGEFPTDRVFIY